MEISVRPIGTIRTPFKEQTGTPIQPYFAKGAMGWIELERQYLEGLADLAGFDRIWLIYWFDRAREVSLTVKPYLDQHTHGVFATRAPARPNPIGMSCVRLLEVQEAVLRVAEVDILDGTPLLDIKPYVMRFDALSSARQGWMDHVPFEPGSSFGADSRFESDERRE